MTPTQAADGSGLGDCVEGAMLQYLASSEYMSFGRAANQPTDLCWDLSVTPKSFHTITQPKTPKPLQWHPVVSNHRTLAPTLLKPWLTDTGSLTRALIQLAGNSFNVSVISQQWQRVLADEAISLKLRPNSYALIREVELRQKHTALVCARTIIPVNTYRKNQLIFRQLGTRSIGEWLFTDPHIHRGAMEICCTSKEKDTWVRRSLFYIKNDPLMVCEAFLPAFNDRLKDQLKLDT